MSINPFSRGARAGRSPTRLENGSRVAVLGGGPAGSFFGYFLQGNVVTIAILGTDIDEVLLQSFLNAPEVKRCFPPDWRWDQPICGCFPRITVRGAARPYADRVVFIGDCGVSRLYKDGIGAAYRAAKAAAVTSIFEGISAGDFERRYYPACRTMETDNGFGRVIFAVTHLIQRICLSRKVVLRMTSREQKSRAGSPSMSSVLWDTFTGSAPYREIFFRTLHPAVCSRFLWNLAASLVDRLSESVAI